MGVDLRAHDGERRRSPKRALSFGRRDGDRVRLTDRQAEVLEFVAAGLENKQIAAALGISEQGVKQQVSVLLQKLGAPSRAVLARMAFAMKLLGTTAQIPDVPVEYLFDRAPILISVTRGPEHRFVLVNRAYVELFGERDYVGRTYRECFPEAPAESIGRLDSLYATGETFSSNERRREIVLPGGERREVFLSLVVQPTRDRDGSVGGVIFFGRDVTQEVAMRRRLERIRTEQQVLLEQLPLGVVYLDARGHATLVNPIARRLLGGIDPELPMAAQATGWNVRLAETGERLTSETAISARAMRGWPFDGKVLITRPADGATITLRVSARPLHDEHGAVTGATMIISEVNGAD